MLFAALLCGLRPAAADSLPATAVPPARARLAIVIDDVGHSAGQVHRVLAVPGAAALGVLPHTPAAADAAALASRYGKEVILHQPMQNVSGFPLGPGGLNSSMGREAFVARLEASLAAVPHSLGVSNHTGSLLTQSPQRMDWLMQTLAARNLFFLDSRTTPHTVAVQLARQRGVPALQRDVFLDHDPSPRVIHREFERALHIATRRGRVVIIAHPYPATLSLLAARLPELGARGIRQVLLSELLPPRGAADLASVGGD